MAESRRFEITLVSAENLPDVRRLGRMKTYAAVSLNGATKSTHVDAEGDSNPRWNSRFLFTVDESSLQRSELTVVVNLFSERFMGDKFIGEAKLPVKELLAMGVGSHKTLSYPVYGTAKGTLNIHCWFEEKVVEPPPHREKNTHTGSVQIINNVLIQLFEAPKIAPQVETTAAPLKALEPPKTPPRIETSEATLRPLQAANVVPRVGTNVAQLKPLEPPKIVYQGETNGATFKSQQAPKVLPRGEANVAPLKSLEAPKAATQGQTNGAALKSQQAPKVLTWGGTNAAPLKSLEAPKPATQGQTSGAALKSQQAAKVLTWGETNMAQLKSLEALKATTQGQTNGAALKSPQPLKTVQTNVAPLKAPEAPKTVTHATKALPQGGTNVAPLKAPEAQKDTPHIQTNGAVLKPGMSQKGKANAAPLEALKAPKAVSR